MKPQPEKSEAFYTETVTFQRERFIYVYCMDNED